MVAHVLGNNLLARGFLDFESSASANSATPAIGILNLQHVREA